MLLMDVINYVLKNVIQLPKNCCVMREIMKHFIKL